MKNASGMVGQLLALAFAAALVIAPVFAAEAPSGFSRKVLQDQDLAVPGRHAVVALIEVAVGSAAGRHTHPGEEFGYVVQGTFQIEVEGKAPQTLKAGETFFIPAGVVHSAKNAGDTPV